MPVLGDIPLVGYAFRSRTHQGANRFVFVVTPTAYNANSPQQAVGINDKDRQTTL